MNLLINAISLKEGGGLLVLCRLVEGFSKLFPHVHLNVIVNSEVAHYKEFEKENVKLHVYSYAERNPLLKRLWYDFILPKFSVQIGADILFSLTNYLPRHLKTPSLLLVQNAGHFSEVFKQMHFESFPGLLNYSAWQAKTSWVYKSIMKADMVTVQTKSVQDVVIERLGIADDKIGVIPHGPGVCNLSQKTKLFPRNQLWRVGYITMYGVQKNFKVLFKAIAELHQRGYKVTLVLCLDIKNKKNEELLEYTKQLGIRHIIENHGDVPFDEVQKIYHTLDLFVFPSLCESFGFSMVEAMACAIPILAADVPGNREITGTAGIFFQPHDDQDLTEKLVDLMGFEEKYHAASDASLRRASNFSWLSTVEKTMKLIESVANKKSGASAGLQSIIFDQSPANIIPHTLTVVILTYNEEKNIAQALKSVAGWADEIFILDSFSTDRTLEIAKQHRCHIAQNKFEDYAKQRNYALDHLSIRSEWILFLDADEWMPEALKQEISERVKYSPEENGFFMRRRLVWMGHWLRRGYYPTWILRLFRNGKGRCESRSVNEHIIVKGNIGKLRNDFMHEDNKGLSDWIAKHNKYASLEAFELLRQKSKISHQEIKVSFFGSQVERKRWLKYKIWNHLPLLIRPFIYFSYRYFFKMGFLDGWPGLSYHCLQGLWFPFLIDVKYLEIKRKELFCKTGHKQSILKDDVA